MNNLCEILLLDKPKGVTSYDCIRVLKKRYPKGTKIGHAGTLDPAASGLLIVGVGGGTKRLEEFLKLPKTYVAEVLLGVKTDTGDLDGEILEQVSVSHEEFAEKELEKTVKHLEGTHELPVPRYSAIKQGGEPLYKKVRRGEIVQPPKRKMHVEQARLLSHFQQNDQSVLEIELSALSGVYIRSIAEELGRRLGVPTTIQNLRRTRIGDFDIKDARGLEQ